MALWAGPAEAASPAQPPAEGDGKASGACEAAAGVCQAGVSEGQSAVGMPFTSVTWG